MPRAAFVWSREIQAGRSADLCARASPCTGCGGRVGSKSAQRLCCQRPDARSIVLFDETGTEKTVGGRLGCGKCSEPCGNDE
jgi:hypothetical protein